MSSTGDRLRRSRITGAVYLVGLLCLLFPAADLVTNVWPMRFTDVQWRYGAVGLGSGFLLTPLLGLVVIAVLATIQSRIGILRAVGVVGLLVGIGLLGATLLFVLDAQQVQTGVQAQDQGFFRTAVIRALGKNLLGAVGFGALGVGAFRTVGSAQKTTRARKRRESGGEDVLVR